MGKANEDKWLDFYYNQQVDPEIVKRYKLGANANGYGFDLGLPAAYTVNEWKQKLAHHHDRIVSNSGPRRRCIWIGGLDPAIISMDTVRDKLAPFQPISEDIHPNGHYMMIDFRSDHQALDCFEEIQEVLGDKIEAKMALGTADLRGLMKKGTPGPCLHVSNLHPSVKPFQLESLFCKFGPVDIRLMQKGNYAFVDYPHVDMATVALRTLYGTLLADQVIAIEYSRSKSSHRKGFQSRRTVAPPTRYEPSNPKVREIISKFVDQYIRLGDGAPAFERKTAERTKQNPLFSFLRGGPDRAYFESQLAAKRSRSDWNHRT